MESWFVFPALALCAGILALTPMGTQVLRRGVVFIDLAVAQAAAAAVIWGNYKLQFDSPLMDQIAATLGATVVSLGVAWVTRKWSAQREALIGLIYVASACMALLGASQHPHGREKLFHLLAADVLWVDPFSVGILILAALAVHIIRLKHWLANDAFFYSVFAVIASVAVPALGLFLVFASLIAPALWIQKGFNSWAAMGTASLFCLIGLLLSWLADTPSGPTVVITLAVFGVCAMFRRQTEGPDLKDPSS